MKWRTPVLSFKRVSIPAGTDVGLSGIKVEESREVLKEETPLTVLYQQGLPVSRDCCWQGLQQGLPYQQGLLLA